MPGGVPATDQAPPQRGLSHSHWEFLGAEDLRELRLEVSDEILIVNVLVDDDALLSCTYCRPTKASIRVSAPPVVVSLCCMPSEPPA